MDGTAKQKEKMKLKNETQMMTKYHRVYFYTSTIETHPILYSSLTCDYSKMTSRKFHPKIHPLPFLPHTKLAVLPTTLSLVLPRWLPPSPSCVTSFKNAPCVNLQTNNAHCFH